MAGHWSDQDIAATLNRMGMPTGQGKTWTAHRVRSIRRVHGIHAYKSAEKGGEWLTLREAAAGLGVTSHRIRKLIKAVSFPPSRLSAARRSRSVPPIWQRRPWWRRLGEKGARVTSRRKSTSNVSRYLKRGCTMNASSRWPAGRGRPRLADPVRSQQRLVLQHLAEEAFGRLEVARGGE